MSAKSEKMLQSLLVEVCGREAKSVIRAAMREYSRLLRAYEGSSVLLLEHTRRYRRWELPRMLACARYERAKKRRSK